MKKFFSYDPDTGVDLHDTEEQARQAAQEAIDMYRDCAADGWCEEVGNVCYGKLSGHACEVAIDDDVSDYELKIVD